MIWEQYILCECGGEAPRKRTTPKERKDNDRAAQHQIFICEKCGKRISETIRRRIKPEQSAQSGQL